MTYDPFGALTGMNLGNGLTAANAWGLDGRLKTRRLTSGTGATAQSPAIQTRSIVTAHQNTPFWEPLNQNYATFGILFMSSRLSLGRIKNAHR
jgi:hypothetical protein